VKEYGRHMRADENVCRMKILILHEHEAISTEQIRKRNACCVPRYRRLSEAEGEKQVKGIHIAYEAPAKVVKETLIS
jgi:hypothetical protein